MPSAWSQERSSSNGGKQPAVKNQQAQQPLQQGMSTDAAACSTKQPQNNGNASGAMEDAALFHTPQDLICPITHELLHDPVITAAGQVYERSAIEHHLQRCLKNALGNLTDPVTNLPLPSAQLLPVHPMRSRAMEYRETAARACIERAADAHVVDPVAYLRRAAELLAPCYGSSDSNGSGDMSSRRSRDMNTNKAEGASSAVGSCKVAGMSSDFARYLVAHQGPAYEALALKYFANELRRSGHIDQAAAVLYRLLLSADGDRQQQTEYLDLCLDCWAAASSSNHDTSSSSDGSNGRDSSSGTEAGVRQLAPEPELVNKLADFVEQQRGFTAGQMLDMLSGARLGKKLLLALVEELLGRSIDGSTSSSGRGGTGGDGDDSTRRTSGSFVDGVAGASSSELAHHKDLLVRYVRLSMAELGEEFEALQARVEGQKGHQRQQQQDQEQQEQSGKPQQEHASLRWCGAQARSLRHTLTHQGGRVAASAVLAAASLVGGNHPVLRVARLGPLMWLLHKS